MAKFNVLVTRDCTESTIVDVEADSPEEARELALEEARNAAANFDWTRDECSEDAPYLADPDQCVENENV